MSNDNPELTVTFTVRQPEEGERACIVMDVDRVDGESRMTKHEVLHGERAMIVGLAIGVGLGVLEPNAGLDDDAERPLFVSDEVMSV